MRLVKEDTCSPLRLPFRSLNWCRVSTVEEQSPLASKPFLGSGRVLCATPPPSSCPVALCAFPLFLVLWHPLPVSS